MKFTQSINYSIKEKYPINFIFNTSLLTKKSRFDNLLLALDEGEC